MEKLIVKNFLTLKDIEIDVNKVNIVIGPQATGKSLIAKLVYFFKSFKTEFRDSVLNGNTIDKFNNKILNKFNIIFDSSDKFDIIYLFGQYEIKIFLKKSEANGVSCKLEYSDAIKNKFEILKNKYSVSLEEARYIKEFGLKLEKEISDIFSDESRFERYMFIPAGRSFFSNLQRNIWTLLSEDITSEIDYFLKEFGANYEIMKKRYSSSSENKIKEIDLLFKNIVKGDYQYKENIDWIYSDGRRTRLLDSSSGQQEVLPMLIVMSLWAFLSDSCFFLVEEPETHLYPTSQKSMVELFSLIYNLTNRETKFFITTHSPYILTSFNNLIQADNTYNSISNKENKDVLLKKLFEIVPQNKFVSFDDVSAYYLDNGYVKDIKDYEHRIIDANKIDDVSNELSRVFGDLVDLQYGGNE